MPPLSAHPSSDLVKMLLIGETGTGKTASLASLARAGYNLYVLDFDNGLDILATLLANDKEALARVNFETCTDKYIQGLRGPVPQSAKAFQAGVKILSNWPGKGPLDTWTPQDVLVIDSLTMMSSAAKFFGKQLDNKLFEKTEIQHWGYAMDAIEGVLALLYSDQTKCNVIVISHITFLENEYGGIIKGYPSALGNKLPPKVGRYFNAALQVRSRGAGKTLVREILTRTEGMVELKTPIFGKLPETLPVETGLATYFNLCKGT